MKNILLLIFLFLVSTSAAMAQAVLDTTASGQCSAGVCTVGDTTLTVSVSTGTGSNRQMSVFVFVGCPSSGTAPSVLSVTYDTTQSLSLTTSVAPVAARRGELWTMPAGTQPNSGTHNVVVVLSSSITISCGSSSNTLSAGIITSTGVDQSSPYASTPLTNSGTGANPTLTGFTSGANDLGVESICSGDGITSTTETIKWNNANTSNSCGSNGGATALGGDTSFSWAIPSDSWIIIGGALKSSGAGAACVPSLTLIGVGAC